MAAKIETLTDIIKMIQDNGNKEICLYAPYHSIFWEISTPFMNMVNYITLCDGTVLSETNIVDLINRSPFDLIKIYFSFQNGVDFKDGFIIRCDEDVDLVDFLYCTLFPAGNYKYKSGSYRERKRAITTIFSVDVKKKNEIVYTLSDSSIRNIEEYFQAFERPSWWVTPFGLHISDALHTKIILFDDPNLATTHIVNALSTFITGTKGPLKRAISNAFKQYKKPTYGSDRKKISYRGRVYEDISSSQHLLKVCLKNFHKMNNIAFKFNELYKKHFSKGTGNTVIDTDILEKMFDYVEWGRILTELLSFEPRLNHMKFNKCFKIGNIRR